MEKTKLQGLFFTLLLLKERERGVNVGAGEQPKEGWDWRGKNKGRWMLGAWRRDYFCTHACGNIQITLESVKCGVMQWQCAVLHLESKLSFGSNVNTARLHTTEWTWLWVTCSVKQCQAHSSLEWPTFHTKRKWLKRTNHNFGVTQWARVDPGQRSEDDMFAGDK